MGTRRKPISDRAARANGGTYLRDALMKGDYARARRWAKAFAKTLSSDPDEWKRLVGRYAEMIHGKGADTRALVHTITETTVPSAEDELKRKIADLTKVRASKRTVAERADIQYDIDRLNEHLETFKDRFCRWCGAPILGTPAVVRAPGKADLYYHAEHVHLHKAG
jgi:hypothetical protein